VPEIHVQTGVGRVTVNARKSTTVPPLVYTAVTVVGVGTALVRPADLGIAFQFWGYVGKDGMERYASSQVAAVKEALGLTTLPEWTE
jgi:hypothetical protein